MAKSNAQRVREARDKLRRAGLRPVQVWIPDARTPDFAEEIRRQCLLLAAAANTPSGREEAAFWEAASADAWDDLD